MALDKTQDPNLEFMVKVGQGEPALRILLSKRREGQSVDPEVQGESVPADEEGLLPARHSDVKLYGGPKFITFWDLGRKWDGSQFADVQYTVAPTYDYVIGGAGTASYRTTTVPTLSQLEDLQNLILEDNLTQLEKNHPMISMDEAEYFNIEVGSSFFGDIGTWTDKGLKMTQAELNALTSLTISLPRAFFNSLVLTGDNKMTITRVNDPDGPVESYTPRNSDKIFLMPCMPRPNGRIRYRDFAVNHGLGLPPTALRTVEAYESFDFMVVPRTPMFDPDSPHYLLNTDQSSWNPIVPVSSSSDIEKYIESSRIINFIQAYGSNSTRAEAVNISATFNDFTWHSYVGSGFPPSSHFPSDTVPPVSSGGPSWIVWGDFMHGNALGSASANGAGTVPSIATGALLALIKQGSRIFYVWR